jgi:hypothetical protein
MTISVLGYECTTAWEKLGGSLEGQTGRSVT